MNIAFHTGKTAMIAQAQALNVYGNNIANINTYGYQTVRPSFADCLYSTQRATEADWQTGHGAYIQRTGVMFDESSFYYTERPLDFALPNEGFFAVEDRYGDINYTRDGAFAMTQADAMLSASEQVRTEYYHEGDLIRVYVVEVRRSTKGPQVIVSRTHPGLVKRLFELEVPEIASGLVEIKSIAREAGSRTKLAVYASQDGIDPVGACVGTRGARVGAVVNELHGEKMDIIVWSEDPAKFVAAALSPADVKSVTLLPGSAKACRVIVPDDQLSLAIGKEGQNARLAARLTGYKIDIKPASQEQELEAIDAQPDEAPEDAEPQA